MHTHAHENANAMVLWERHLKQPLKSAITSIIIIICTETEMYNCASECSSSGKRKRGHQTDRIECNNDSDSGNANSVEGLWTWLFESKRKMPRYRCCLCCDGAVSFPFDSRFPDVVAARVYRFSIFGSNNNRCVCATPHSSRNEERKKICEGEEENESKHKNAVHYCAICASMLRVRMCSRVYGICSIYSEM